MFPFLETFLQAAHLCCLLCVERAARPSLVGENRPGSEFLASRQKMLSGACAFRRSKLRRWNRRWGRRRLSAICGREFQVHSWSPLVGR